ncbi:hypothetical protein GOODEAATRI_010970 [Goodea atripinnis]|uniref:Uncharacterized protein n=1 Tax=Goodea atripinnis TaxID=208336 RepID=A0ABV0PXK4_9TELE
MQPGSIDTTRRPGIKPALCPTQNLGHRVARVARCHCPRFTAVIHTETNTEEQTWEQQRPVEQTAESSPNDEQDCLHSVLLELDQNTLRLQGYSDEVLFTLMLVWM